MSASLFARSALVRCLMALALIMLLGLVMHWAVSLP